MSQLSEVQFAANEAISTGIAHDVLEPAEFQRRLSSLFPRYVVELAEDHEQGPAKALAGYDSHGILRTALCRLTK